MRRTRPAIACALLLFAAGAALTWRFGRPLWHPAYLRLRGRRTVGRVLAQQTRSRSQSLSPQQRVKARCRGAGLNFPPKCVAFVTLKKEKLLELWAQDHAGRWRFVHAYSILAASGHAGPKLREGDRQVPEGVYRIEALNPNSSYHLSMKINYPNEFDRRKARQEGRSNPGGDIFIHGKAASIGCVAMGDEAIEELFHLVGVMWPAEVKVLIAPNDIRNARPAEPNGSNPPWVEEVYGDLRRELGILGPRN